MPRPVNHEQPAQPAVSVPNAAAAAQPVDALQRNADLAAQFVASGLTDTPQAPQGDAEASAALKSNVLSVELIRAKLLKEAAEKKAEDRAAYARGEKKLGAVGAHDFSQMDDTVPMHSDGTTAIREGYATRWARLTDHTERPSPQRVGEYTRWGYKPIMDRVTGKPITSAYGVALEATVEDEARRQVRWASEVMPESEKINELEAAITGLNRELGKDALSVIRNAE